jgi:hypothetical protein
MSTDPTAAAPEGTEQQALADALAAVLEPLARLAVARGLPFAALEELAKSAFVRAAHRAHPDLPEHRRVSRISTTTGLSRREVTRIVQTPERKAPPRSLASDVFARWMTGSSWRDPKGKPRALPRQGEAGSFEALAHSITRDVHPRSLLEELVRLGLARLDTETDEVSLVLDAFVPRGDAVRMVRFLGENVGDHLAGAVANVLGDGSQHFEQAVFADGLSEQSMADFRTLVKAQWQSLRQAMVPALQALIDADRQTGRVQDQRLRIGLYTYQQADAVQEPATLQAPTTRRGRSSAASGTGASTDSPRRRSAAGKTSRKS